MNDATVFLPQEFASLERFCSRWCLCSSQERNAERINASMEDIQDFYDAVTLHADQALARLAKQKLGELCVQDENLLRLMLSLAELGPAVEWFQQPRVVDGCDESKFPLVAAIPDLDAQGTAN